jgi:hypothetical protein
MLIQITLRQSTDEQEVTITQRCCTASRRTLGVHENPSSNLQTEFEHLLSKGKKMSHLISAQFITRTEAWTAYRSIYLLSMSYSFPRTSFNRRELAKVQSRPINAQLSAMAFNRNMPREVVFGPTSNGGIGLRHLYVEQGCQKMSALLQHIQQHSQLGKIMWYLLQWTQVNAGVGFFMYSLNLGEIYPMDDFLADSLRMYNRDSQYIHSHKTAGSRRYPHGGRNDEGLLQTAKCGRSIVAGCPFRSNACQTYAQLTDREQILDLKQSHQK